jgi:hypothetical protein
MYGREDHDPLFARFCQEQGWVGDEPEVTREYEEWLEAESWDAGDRS